MIERQGGGQLRERDRESQRLLSKESAYSLAYIKVATWNVTARDRFLFMSIGCDHILFLSLEICACWLIAFLFFFFSFFSENEV
jgi:hypothetical protein